MFQDFQLAAIVKVRGQYQFFYIPLHQALQNQLSQSWLEQYTSFMTDIEEVDFDPGYQSEAHERYKLVDYQLPEPLNDENRQSLRDLDTISLHEEQIDDIKGVVAYVQAENNDEIVLFQNFSRSHVINPGRFLFLQNNTYESTQRPGLALENKLSAVFMPSDSKLLFQNFRITNSFLSLAEYYEEASEETIREILQHDQLLVEDIGALAVGASQWFCKRFALLKDSEILDQYTPQQIASHAEGFGVDIQLEDEKIVFPSDKAPAKKLLQFLNEELYKGPITETLYETNSKREADQ